MMIFNRSKERGFTLIEAIVAIFILSLGIIPSLSIVLYANSFTSVLKNNLIGTNLAQEGAEVVRALRDSNWFNGRAFDFGLANGTYRLEWNSASLITEFGSNPVLKIDSNGLYNYTSGTDTPFHRRIFIVKDPTAPGCDCELRVVVKVSWVERKSTRVITVESHLFDWN